MDIKNTKGPEAPARPAINATLMDIAIVGARMATDKAVVSIMFSRFPSRKPFTLMMNLHIIFALSTQPLWLYISKHSNN
jgi:hypothetical protein